ncbi:MAG: D-aminoacyl-tRNA deacylase [Acidimicrobiia bacterium]
MRAVVQRVSDAAVTVDGDMVSEIGIGLLALIGVEPDDGLADAAALASKLVGLRIFADAGGKMNRSVQDVGGGVLVVSQFTLLGDMRKGRRPSFAGAAPPEVARTLVDQVADRIRETGVPCATGVFGARMEVRLTNDGPVTLVLDVKDGRLL